MELWEFNACVRAYNEKRQDEAKERLFIAWRTAAFTGAAFAGKLRSFSHYVKDTDKKTAPQTSKGEFEARLKALKEGRTANGSKGP